MKIESVDQVLDDINEANDQMKQIQDALAMPTGLGADLDEDELLEELEVGGGLVCLVWGAAAGCVAPTCGVHVCVWLAAGQVRRLGCRFG